VHVGPLAIGTGIGRTALLITWQHGPRDVRCRLWILDADGQVRAQVPVPHVAYLTHVHAVEFVGGDRYVLVHHRQRPSLFAATALRR
jgi:hypothetical protein